MRSDYDEQKRPAEGREEGGIPEDQAQRREETKNRGQKSKAGSTQRRAKSPAKKGGKASRAPARRSVAGKAGGTRKRSP
jgi:hypothetical protein